MYSVHLGKALNTQNNGVTALTEMYFESLRPSAQELLDETGGFWHGGTCDELCSHGLTTRVSRICSREPNLLFAQLHAGFSRLYWNAVSYQHQILMVHLRRSFEVPAAAQLRAFLGRRRRVSSGSYACCRAEEASQKLDCLT